MKRGQLVLAGALLAVVRLPTADAQGVRAGQRLPRAEQGAGRQQLEAGLRQRLWRVTKNRVGLSDGQMSRLATTSRGFEERRRALAVEERQQRQQLRREILAGAAADQASVSAAIDRLLAIQRQRLDVMAEEQRALAAFMTPVQRAKYVALREQLRKRAEGLRAGRADTTDTP